MSSQDSSTIQPESKTPGDSQVAARGLTSKMPSVEQLLAELNTTQSLPPKGTETLSADEQKELFDSLQNLFKRVEEDGEDEDSFDLKEIHASLYQEDESPGHKYKALEGVRLILDKLWKSNSDYLIEAANLLANGSREQSLRLPYGQAGILDFFLGVIASFDDVGNDLLFHSLRLTGNSCADTDENRAIVVKGNYIPAIIRQLSKPNLLQVVIPVLYNTCVDYEPAQTQAAVNRIAYILLKLIKKGAFKENEALVGFVHELIEQATEQEQGIEQSPDGTVSLFLELISDDEIAFTEFASLASCLMAYLNNQRFRDICVSERLVESVLSVLRRSFSIQVDSIEETQVVVQLQLKTNQTLSEVSDSPLFMENYPLNSSLSQTLKQWLASSEENLQICSCVMLGNQARSDEVCETMVRDLKIHEELISILKSDARGAVLHSALGFLKNLAIAGDNRLHMGEAGIVPAISRLWGYETVPQVQFAATSIARQLIISSVENISRMLESPPSPNSDSPTYFSLLLSLFEKTDSAPIKTEIGRIVASICRTLVPKSREEESSAQLLDRLFSTHERIARPIGAMITQTQWPVVRSEGWFALALMTFGKPGSLAVIDCLENMEVYPLLEETLRASPESADEAEKVKITKDRDNTIILVRGLLNNDGDVLPTMWKSELDDLMKSHVSLHLKS